MPENICTLSHLKPGESGKIEEISDKLPFKRRLMDIGFIKGFNIECLQKSMLGDPVCYLINNTVVALRKKDSSHISVSRIWMEE